MLTTKDTKSTKFGDLILRNLRVLRDLLGKYMCTYDMGDELA